MVFVGDDVNDEPVSRPRGRPGSTVRVGDDPRSLAQFYLRSFDEVMPMLDRVLGCLGDARRV